MDDDLFMPGYNMIYHEGMAAYHRGADRESFFSTDPQAEIAFRRGWDRAREATEGVAA